MNVDVNLTLGALLIFVLIALLVFCFTEAKGKNTPHARKLSSADPQSIEPAQTTNAAENQKAIPQ